MLPSSSPLDVHLIADVIAKEAPTKVRIEYDDFVFSPDLAFKYHKRTDINNHTIELVNGQQTPYGPIYSLGPVDPEGLHWN